MLQFDVRLFCSLLRTSKLKCIHPLVPSSPVQGFQKHHQIGTLSLFHQHGPHHALAAPAQPSAPYSSSSTTPHQPSTLPIPHINTPILSHLIILVLTPVGCQSASLLPFYFHDTAVDQACYGVDLERDGVTLDEGLIWGRVEECGGRWRKDGKESGAEV